jgi:hypothetical protein
VNGNRLAKESDDLARTAKLLGVESLMSFFSISPGELTGLAEDLGVGVKWRTLKPPKEKWFSAEDGYREKTDLPSRILGSCTS